MTRLAAVLLAALALVAYSAPQLAADSAAPQQAVCIINSSTAVSDAAVANAVPAFQAAVDFDFGPVWNQRANLEFVPTGTTPPVGCWTITLMDNIGVFGAAGFHDTLPSDQPYAQVLATPDWSITLTHELFEMLADPRGNRYAGGYSISGFPTKIYVLEVADPVEGDALAYERLGADGSPVYISDFVTERWYDGKGRGRIDFTNHLKRAHTLAPGGYDWVQTNGQWVQNTA